MTPTKYVVGFKCGMREN